MTTTQRTIGLRESGRLLQEGNTPGTRRVRIITEGMGSSGFYSADLIKSSIEAFSGSPSYANHPTSVWSASSRDVKTIMGRIVPGSVAAEKSEGLMSLMGDYLPNSEENADWIAKNGDLVGLSVFAQAQGHDDETGNFVIESFVPAAQDPYRSVDIVVAAGRGGRFEQAQESLQELTGLVPVSQPPAAPAEDHRTKEGHMDPKTIEELKALFKSEIQAFVTEFKAAEEAARSKAEADAKAIEDQVTEAATAAVKSYDEKVQAVNAVENLAPKQKTKLLSLAAEGKDITSELADATEIAAEFATIAESVNDEPVLGRIATEGATADAAAAAKGAF